MGIDCWGKLKFFDSGEWQVLDERIWEETEAGIKINPSRGNLFSALDNTPLPICKAAILGQDPYPSEEYATGTAFDIPPDRTSFPPTLVNILTEYSEDLGLPFPSSGSLLPWCRQGVLLWNVIPTCYAGKPASHHDWTEWNHLTQEIVDVLVENGCVVVSCGVRARAFCDAVHAHIAVSHPSPLAALRGNRPFTGSRLFSEVNRLLVEQGKDPIDWRLP